MRPCPRGSSSGSAPDTLHRAGLGPQQPGVPGGLWPRHGGLLFAADAAANTRGLHDPVLFEDLETGRRTQRDLAALEFEVATFGHGPVIGKGAARAFRQQWGGHTHEEQPGPVT